MLPDAREALEEKRVAGGALHERSDLVVGEAAVARRRHRERSRVVLGEGLEAQRQGGQRRSPRSGSETVLSRPPGRAREPRTRGELRSEVPQQLRRRVVHPVHVVEHQEGRRVEQLAEERPHDAVQARPPEGRVEGFDLRRGLDLDVEWSGQQRRPGHELVVDLLQALAEDRAIVLTPAVQLYVEQRPEERAERVVRSRRLVLRAAQVDLTHVGAVLPQLLCEA